MRVRASRPRVRTTPPVIAALLAAAALVAPPCSASSLRACERGAPPSAQEKDLLLRFGAIVKTELADSGRDVALIARSGLDLHRLGVRYSHAGVVLRDNGDVPWAVRELYYACDEKKPRIYDEGMAGFLLGTDDPSTSWVSLLLLPPAASAQLERAALDRRQALRVLGSTYSANAYPFSTRYQNCNQWVMELLAGAWGGLDDGAAGGAETPSLDADTGALAARERAQRWLYSQGYAPTVFEVSARPMMWLGDLVPWLHNDDHPPADVDNDRYSVSMPLAIETFVHRTLPEAQRIEICHVDRRVVVHRGWDEIADGCVAGPGDRAVELGAD